MAYKFSSLAQLRKLTKMEEDGELKKGTVEYMLGNTKTPKNLPERSGAPKQPQRASIYGKPKTKVNFGYS